MNYIDWNLNVCFIFHTMYMRAVPSQRKHHSAPTPNLYAKKISKIWFTIEHYNGPYWFCHWLNDYKSLQIYPVKKYKAPNFYWADLWAIFKKVMAAQGTKNTMHCLYIITYTHKHNRVMSLFHSLPQMLLWKFPFLLLSTVF